MTLSRYRAGPALRFAHRGFHRLAVENSLPAFALAYDAGCEGVEFDVQLTRDGLPIIFHDDDLPRLAGVSGEVHALAWPELRGLVLRQNGNEAAMPTLADFLKRFGHRRFYLEMKVPAAKQEDMGFCRALARACIQSVAQAHPHPETFFASFHLPLMQWVQEEYPQLSLAAIHEDEFSLQALLRLPEGHALRRLRYHSLPYGAWDSCRRGGLPLPQAKALWLWDIRGPRAFQAAREAGIAGMVADDVEEMMGGVSE